MESHTLAILNLLPLFHLISCFFFSFQTLSQTKGKVSDSFQKNVNATADSDVLGWVNSGVGSDKACMWGKISIAFQSVVPNLAMSSSQILVSSSVS